MRFGGLPTCLASMSSAAIELKDDYRPIDLGYEQAEKSLRRGVIATLMVVIVVSVLLLSFAIYKSYKQKQIRLDLLRLTEDILRKTAAVKAL